MVSSAHSPAQKLEDDAKQILVQLDDGSTWKAEQRADGLYLIEQLRDPTSFAKGSGDEEPEDSTDKSETEDASDDAGEPEESGDDTDSPAEPEPAGDPYEDMFSKAPTAPTDFDSMFDGMPSASGMPDELREKLKDPAFRARLSSIMLDNKYDRKLRGRTRGKLDMSRLPKVPMMQRNVFTQKQSRKGKAYNVVLLVDESGSMGGSPGDPSGQAAEATLFLLSMLEGININVAVIGFNGSVMIHKPWDKKADYDLVYKQITYHHQEPWDDVCNPGWNNDYDAMHFGYEYFKKAPEGENILIMLSDGEPASHSHTVDFVDEKGNDVKFKPHKIDSYVKDSDKAIHRLVHSYKDVHSFGIGIFEGGWQIPEHEVIHNLGDLKKAVANSLRKGIKRG